MTPRGFSFAGVHAGIKQDPSAEDISLIVSDLDCTGVGVYTQNRVVAAPVTLDRQRTPSEEIRAIVINSGNANACTGRRGMENAVEMSGLVASSSNVRPEQVLVLSTGIIGTQLPMDRIAAGIATATGQLAADDNALVRCARGMMTTDTRHKLVQSELALDGKAIGLVGIAKGAAMIGPKMATMLAVIVTDAALTSEDAQRILREAVDDSFNCISVEGHMSTNDTVLLLANGAACDGPLRGEELSGLRDAVQEACIHLAREIPNDGEGATHLIEIEVQGCRNRDEAHRIARTVADSPLVKTAVAGADPNWGRIISAAGYAGTEFDPTEIQLVLNGTELYRDGTPLDFDAEQVAQSIRANRDTHIQLQLQRGTSSVRFWTCDLTSEYVRLNADYHT